MASGFWRLFTRIALVLAGTPLFCACAKYGISPPQINKVEFYPSDPIEPGEELTVTAQVVLEHGGVMKEVEAQIGRPVKLRIVLNDAGQYPDPIAGDDNWTGSVKWIEGIGAGRGLPVTVTCRAMNGNKSYRDSMRAKNLLMVDSSRKPGNK